ncbi:MAG: LysR family transcriptional regulator [Burkholderiaceae bacterium]
MDWHEIQLFVAVAEQGSLSAAARNLNISQPTVGRVIQALERRFDGPLFRRHARGLTLTELGHDVLREARGAQQAIAQIDLIRAGRQSTLAGSVRITAPVFMTHMVLPAIIAVCRSRYPQIALELVANDQEDSLMFHEADIALRAFESTQGELVSRRVGAMAIAAVASTDYLERRGSPQRAEDLLSHDLIGFDRNTMIIDAMRARGWEVGRDHFSVRCDDQAAYARLVMAGCGIGFIAWPVARREPGLRRVLEDLPTMSITLWLAAHERIHRVPRVRAVWEILYRGLVAQCESDTQAE